MKKILLVDDDRGIRESLKDILEKKGYMVDFATNGIEGMELFKKHRHPVVLVDLVMPGLDGKGLLNEIKRIQPETSVIVITGYRIIGKMIETLRKDIVCVMEKPLDIDSLLERIEELLKE
jgi:DNA-binding NtrC family response regulator